MSCGVCGWPARGGACEACGAPAGAGAAGADTRTIFVMAGPRPEDYPQLQNAFVAWKQRDFGRMIGQCLAAIGLDAPTVHKLPRGHGWVFVEDSAVVFVVFDREREELSVESPLVRVPRQKRVPLMRALLEINARALGSSRFCLREDRVVLRFADRLENLSPPKVVSALREVAGFANALDDLLAIGFDASMIGPEARRSHAAFGFLGEPRDLPLVRARAEESRRSLAELGQAAAARRRIAPVAADRSDPSREASRATAQARLEAHEGVTAIVGRAMEVDTELRFRNVSLHLRVLSMRAAVYRAYDRYRDAAPDVVAALVEAAAPVLVEVPAPRRALLGIGSGGDEVASSAAMAMAIVFASVVKSRGQVRPERKVEVTPLAHAGEAKQLLRAVLEQLDAAPRSDALRYGVLLGALAELRARAPLPDALAERIGKAMEDSEALGETAEAIDYLDRTVRRMAS